MPYHLRRTDKAITDPEAFLEIIRHQCVMTLALCKDNEPYLVTVDYAFDAETRCFYFHCAREGKKLDYLRANPTVWGQVLEDRGYLTGECSHAYRTVQFRGHAEWIEDLEEKRAALGLMIDQIDPDPASVRQSQLSSQAALQNVGLVRIRIEEWSGKQGPAPTS